MRLYKILNEDGSCANGGEAVWSLPTKREDGTWQPGEWMPKIGGPLEACENGYHACRQQDIISWLGPAWWEKGR